MVFGTFDLLHHGHLNFFRQALRYGKKLTVVVARDKNVKKIKGQPPKFKEKQRLNNIRGVKLADKVILGDLRDPYRVIKKEKPEIICLGYDQKEFTKDLRNLFPRIRIIRLKSYKPNIYKSSKLEYYARHQ